MSALTIGIDFGTTKTCVAVLRHGRVEIIPNEKGNKTTPNYVSFTDAGRLIGEDAKNEAVRNPKYTVFDTLRMAGNLRSYPDVQQDIDHRHWPFKLLTGTNEVIIEIYEKENEKENRILFTSILINKLIMIKIKKEAEKHLGKMVTDVVITVPAHFDKLQRFCCMLSAKFAELNVKHTVSQPIALAMAYRLRKKLDREQKVLIFDQGGGQLTVSVLSVADNVCQVLSTAVDIHVGGLDFDFRLVKHFYDEFERKHGIDLRYCPPALLKLRMACEEAKRTLSSAPVASVHIESLYEEIDFSSKITRPRFEELCKVQFKGAIDTVQLALQDAKLESSSIDDVVLVGGSTRMPKIRKLLEEFFDGKELNLQLNAEEAVAVGAAIYAAACEDEKPMDEDDDVTPVALGGVGKEGEGKGEGYKQADDCNDGEGQDTAAKYSLADIESLPVPHREPTVSRHPSEPVHLKEVGPVGENMDNLFWAIQTRLDGPTKTSITERLELYECCETLLLRQIETSEHPVVRARCSDLLRQLRDKYGEGFYAYHYYPKNPPFPDKRRSTLADRVVHYVERIFEVIGACENMQEDYRKIVIKMGTRVITFVYDNSHAGTLTMLQKVRKLQRLCRDVGIGVLSDDITEIGYDPIWELDKKVETRRQVTGMAALLDGL